MIEKKPPHKSQNKLSSIMIITNRRSCGTNGNGPPHFTENTYILTKVPC